MRQDYKHVGTHHGRSSERSQPAAWVWLVTGVAVGWLTAIVFYTINLKPKIDQLAAAPKAAAEKPVRAPRTEPDTAPQFDFHQLLTTIEIPTPSDPDPPTPPSPPRPLPSSAPPAPRPAGQSAYLIQVGSFRRAREAESLKARLALLGIEATVQRVRIDDRDTWYRVRVGPHPSERKVRQIQQQLRKNNIHSIVLKLKER